MNEKPVQSAPIAYRRRGVSVVEGSTFEIPTHLVDRHVVGLITRLDSQGNVVAHFHVDTSSDRLLHDKPVLVAKIVAASFTEGRWLITGRISDWPHTRLHWGPVTFRHWDVLRNAGMLREYDDSDLLLWASQRKATELEVVGIPDDGICSEGVIEARLLGLLGLLGGDQA